VKKIRNWIFRIWIHNRYWEGRCFLAYDKGEFGYVDARYVQ